MSYDYDGSDVEELAQCQLLAESPKAIFVLMDDGEKHWIPKSLVSENGTELFEVGDVGSVFVARWFCEKEELSS